ncbi:hypothetical protein ACPA9J_27095 [Pseudomonas aeruginosa]
MFVTGRRRRRAGPADASRAVADVRQHHAGGSVAVITAVKHAGAHNVRTMSFRKAGEQPFNDGGAPAIAAAEATGAGRACQP